MGHRRYGYKHLEGGGLPLGNLVGFYRGEDNALDSSTAANHGTALTMQYTDGIVDRCFNHYQNSTSAFNAYIEIPYIPELNFNGKGFSLTVAFNQKFIGNWSQFFHQATNSISAFDISFAINDGNDLVAFIRDTVVNEVAVLTATDAADESKDIWTTYALTYSGTGLNFKLYKNGVEISYTLSGSTNFQQMRGSTSNFYLGSRPSSNGRFYRAKGFLDECGIWDIGLSSAQILEYHNKAMASINITV